MTERCQRIEKVLKENIEITRLRIKDESHLHAGHAGANDPGGETHVLIEVESPSLEGLSRIQAHRTINGLLKDEFASGLHALRLKIH